MEQWATDTFQTVYGQIVVYTDSNGYLTGVDPSIFGGISFASITVTPPTYASLSALAIAQQGWQKIFDQWKATGLVF